MLSVPQPTLPVCSRLCCQRCLQQDEHETILTDIVAKFVGDVLWWTTLLPSSPLDLSCNIKKAGYDYAHSFGVKRPKTRSCAQPCESFINFTTQVGLFNLIPTDYLSSVKAEIHGVVVGPGEAHWTWTAIRYVASWISVAINAQRAFRQRAHGTSASTSSDT